MTKQETGAILYTMRCAYPAFYSKMSAGDLEGIVNLWTTMFAEDDARLVTDAVKDLIVTHRGFPPEIADVKEKIRELIATASCEPTDEELWAILREAIKDGMYGADEQFKALPPVLKRYCGSPSKLRDLALEDSGTIETVVHGQFLKSIPHMREREEFSKRLSPETRKYLASILKKPPELDAPMTEENFENQRLNIIRFLDSPADV